MVATPNRTPHLFLTFSLGKVTLQPTFDCGTKLHLHCTAIRLLFSGECHSSCFAWAILDAVNELRWPLGGSCGVERASRWLTVATANGSLGHWPYYFMVVRPWGPSASRGIHIQIGYRTVNVPSTHQFSYCLARGEVTNTISGRPSSIITKENLIEAYLYSRLRFRIRKETQLDSSLGHA